jgi:hypothetical protein
MWVPPRTGEGARLIGPDLPEPQPDHIGKPADEAVDTRKSPDKPGLRTGQQRIDERPRHGRDGKERQHRPVPEHLGQKLAHGEDQHSGKERMGKAAMDKGIGDKAAQMLDRVLPGLDHPAQDLPVKAVILDRARAPAHGPRPAHETPRTERKCRLDPDDHQKQHQREGRHRVEGAWVVAHGRSP